MRIILSLSFLIFSAVHLPCYTQNSKIIRINEDIQLVPLKDSIFIHISYHSADGFGRFPSNGLFIINNGKAVMIDTPMDTIKTLILIDYLKDSMGVRVNRFIAGHFHADCMGGLATVHKKNIESLANIRTVEICKELGLPAPFRSFQDSLILNHEGKKVVCQYPGPGHTEDNIVVWLPEDEILFGGCLVKSAGSRNLGNLEDANVGEWDNTLRNLLKRYPEVEIVVPGHGNAGGIELIHHTLKLVSEYKQQAF